MGRAGRGRSLGVGGTVGLISETKNCARLGEGVTKFARPGPGLGKYPSWAKEAKVSIGDGTANRCLFFPWSSRPDFWEDTGG
jgi:hypothetical protein